MLAASTIVLALIVIVALLAYGLAWRATSGRSIVARALVRGVMPLLLLAIPAITLTMISANAPRSFGKIEGQLSAQAPDEFGGGSEAAREARALAETLRAKRSEEDARRQELEASKAQEARNAEQAQASRRKAEESGAREAPKPGGAGEMVEPGMSTLGEQRFGGPQMPGAKPLTAPQAAAPVPPEANQPRIVMPPAPPQAAEAPSDSKIASMPHTGPEEPKPGAAPQSEDNSLAARNLSDTPNGGEAPAAPAVVAPANQSGFDVVPVFFGTDREEEPNARRLTFNAERGRRLELGRALVTVPKVHEVPQIERPWALRVPYFDLTIYEAAEDPKKHFTMQEIKKLPKDAFLQLVRERLGASQRFKDHAIVFVHGYNTSFDYAVYRTAQISYDLKFDGAAFLYSWPSGGAVASYTYDRESAGAAEPYLRQFLEMVVKETGAKSISVIGHSMGNQPLLDVLKDMKSAAPPGVVISQVIFAAPDVDADNFTNLAQRIEGLAQGVTLYAASNDRALIVSRNFWRNPRAGDVLAGGPLIVPGMDTIDVTALSTETLTLNHSGYAENNVLLQDIGRLIADGLRPPDQRLSNLKKITTARGDYWRYTVP